MEQKTKHQDEMVNAQQDMQGQEQVQKQGAEQAQGHEEAQSQEQGIKAKKREGAGGAAQRGAVGQEFQADRAKNGPARAKGDRKPNSSKKMPAKPETGKEVKANPQKDKAAVEQYAQSKGDKTAASVKEGNDVDKAEGKKDNKAVALKDDKAAAKKDDKAAAKKDDKAAAKKNDKAAAKKDDKAVAKKDDKAAAKKDDKAAAKKDEKAVKKDEKVAQKDEKVAAKKEEAAGSKNADKVEQAVAKKEEKAVEKADKTAEKEEKAAAKKDEKVAEKEGKAAETEGKTAEKKGASQDGKAAGKENKGEKPEAKGESKGKADVKNSSGGAGGAGGSKKSSGGGGGGGGGGGISVPSIGGGGPTITQKGAGGGANAVEAFANSGLSYQAENIAGLGAKADVDVAKGIADTESKLPGEEGATITDEAADTANVEMANATRTANQDISDTPYDATLTTDMDAAGQRASDQANAQKGSMDNGDQELPNKPTVESDTAEIDAAAQEEAEKYADAESEGQGMVSGLDRTMPERGFDDLQTQRITIEDAESALQSGEVPMTADVAILDEEGKGILDMTELAMTSASAMEPAKAQVAEAEATRKADTEASVAEHNDAIAQAQAQAEQEEQAMLAQQKADLDSQIDAEAASYEAEISAHNAAQQAEVNAAKAQVEGERQKAQADLDQEYNKGKTEKAAKEREAEEKKNEKRSLLQKIGDAIKSALDAIVSWLKEAISAIVNAVKQAICTILDAFVAIVSRINKELGEKLRKAVEKFKEFLDKLASKLIEIINKILDAILELIKAIVDAVIAVIEAAIEAFRAAINAIIAAFKAAIQAAIDLVKAALASIGEFFITLLKKAMELAGVDPGVFSSALGVAKEIIQNPGVFFSTLGKGFVMGFKQFGANIKENVKAVFTNLFNMWLGTAGLSLPGSFSVKSLIKFGLQVVGVDVDGILNKIGIENLESVTSMKDIKDGVVDTVMSSPAFKFAQDLRQNGISALVNYLGDYLKDLATSIMQEALNTIVQKAATAAIGKLAALATPVSGIIAALKAVWDLIQFVQANMSTIGGLVSAVTSTLAQAAVGDPSGVANGVEAALCRLIPLAIDLLLRLAGIDVGGAIKKLVGKIREKVSGAINKLVSKFKTTKAGQAYEKGKAKYQETKQKVDNAKQAVTDKVDGFKDAVVGKAGEWADNTIAKVDSKVDPMMQNSMDKFGNTKAGQKLEKFNNGAQKMANGLNAWTEKTGEKIAPTMSKMEKATNTLNDFNSAKKVGDAFGLSSEKIANKLTGKEQAQDGDKKEEAGKNAGEKNAELEKPAERLDVDTSKDENAVKEDTTSKDSKASEEKSEDKDGGSEISKKDNKKSKEQLENERLQKETEKNNTESSMRFSQQMYDFYQEQLSKYEAEIAEDGKYHQEKKAQVAELEKNYKGQTPQEYCDQHLEEFKQMLVAYNIQRAYATTQAELLAIDEAYRNESYRSSFEFVEKIQQLCTDYHPVQVAIIERDIAKENLASRIRAYEQYEVKAEEELGKLNGLKAKVEQIHEEISSLDAQIAQFDA